MILHSFLDRDFVMLPDRLHDHLLSQECGCRPPVIVPQPVGAPCLGAHPVELSVRASPHELYQSHGIVDCSTNALIYFAAPRHLFMRAHVAPTADVQTSALT